MKSLITKDFIFLFAVTSLLLCAITQKHRTDVLQRQMNGLTHNVEQIVGILEKQKEMNAGLITLATAMKETIRQQ